jgi:hypothetical protein
MLAFGVFTAIKYQIRVVKVGNQNLTNAFAVLALFSFNGIVKNVTFNQHNACFILKTLKHHRALLENSRHSKGRQIKSPFSIKRKAKTKLKHYVTTKRKQQYLKNKNKGVRWLFWLATI